jgi:hypothetical protein
MQTIDCYWEKENLGVTAREIVFAEGECFNPEAVEAAADPTAADRIFREVDAGLLRDAVQDLPDIGGDDLRVPLVFFHQEHVGHPGEQGDGDIVPEAVGRPHLDEGVVVAVGHGAVELHVHLVGGGAVDGDEDVQLPPAHLLLDQGLDAVLGKDVDSGDLDGTVQIAVVHRPDLYGDAAVVEDLLPPAVAGHASDQSKHAPL